MEEESERECTIQNSQCTIQNAECTEEGRTMLNSQCTIQNAECTVEGEETRVESGETRVESGEMGQKSIEAMVAEAEMRGYLRGRNESIEELMKKPGESSSKPLAPNPGLPPAGGAADILQRMRESIWDRGK